MSIAEQPLGPPRRRLVGNLLEYRRDPLAFVTACKRDYGDFVPLRLGPYRVVLVSDPTNIEQVLNETNTNYGRYLLARLAGSLTGQGLFTSEGELWKRERKLIAPAFHRSAISAMGDVMAQTTSDAIDRWSDGAEIEVMQEMVGIAVQNASRTLFHSDVTNDTADIARALNVVFDTIEQRMGSFYPLPGWVPTPQNRRFAEATKRLNNIIDRIIEHRRLSDEQYDDVIAMLTAEQEKNGAMSDQLLRDEVMALFIGGHETVAGGLAFTWYLLAKHPHVAIRLQQEVGEVVGEQRLPNSADLRELTYTEMVVKESLRLYPPAWGFDRKVTKDCEIGGHRVTKGTIVLIMQWALHRDPMRFERPDEFIPERWAEGMPAGLPKFAYLPFGGGPRFCIGNTFATMEMRLVLATVAQRFNLELAPDVTMVPQPSIILRPRGGIRMTIRRRSKLQ